MEQITPETNILNTIEKLQSQYKGASIKTVIIKEPEIKLHSALITFLDHEDEKEQNFEYDEILLLHRNLKINSVKKMIKALMNNNRFFINGYEFRVNGSFQRIEFIPSKNRFGYLKHKFPRHYVTYTINDRVIITNQPLVASKMPLYPDGNKAVVDFFNMDTNVAPNMIFLQIPDYRARIDKVTISGRKVRIKIISNIPLQDLSLKLYADFERSSYYRTSLEYSLKTPDIYLENEVFEHEFEKDFDYILASLSDKKTGKMIDYRGYNLGWGHQEGIEVSREDLDIREIIRRGEDLVTEFKLELSDEFLETVISFANTKGGIILLGVNDNCQVIGFRPRSDDQIVNLISSNIDPRPQFRVFKRVIDETEITIVEVPEGDNKPYCHREKGFYIRSNSNDRHPTRPEMDRFYPIPDSDYRYPE